MEWAELRDVNRGKRREADRFGHCHLRSIVSGAGIRPADEPLAWDGALRESLHRVPRQPGAHSRSRETQGPVPSPDRIVDLALGKGAQTDLDRRRG